MLRKSQRDCHLLRSEHVRVGSATKGERRLALVEGEGVSAPCDLLLRAFQLRARGDCQPLVLAW